MASLSGSSMACEPCENARTTGWWGPNHVGTHCMGCHRSWGGKREIHCVLCHEHFSAPSVLDLHKRGGECIPPAEVTNKAGEPLLRQRDNGTWAGASEREGWPS